MGHKIRAQIGKTNISGDGNNVTQVGQGNQNNSNNVTHNHYHSANIGSQSNEIDFILFIGIGIFLICFLPYALFKYSIEITFLIKWLHLFLLINLYPIYFLSKIGDRDCKDIINFIFIFGIGTLSFLLSEELFSKSEFHTLVDYAKDKSFLDFWNMVRDWRVKTIYFFIGSILTSLLIVINAYFTISFLKYSLCLKKQNNLIGVFFILIISMFIYYLIIYKQNIVLVNIGKLPFIK